MFRFIMKYLKSYWVWIVVCLSLLFLQAQMNLYLPDYMSKIVNIGIQNQGIEETYPMVMREDTYQLLKEIVADKDVLENSYQKLSCEEASEKDKQTYPILENESVYVLKNESNMNQLSFYEIATIQPIVEAIYMKNKDVLHSFMTPIQIQQALDITQNADHLYEVYQLLPMEMKTMLYENIKHMQQSMGESSSQTFLTRFILNEYQKVGLQTSEIQQSYILIAGLKMLAISLLGGVSAILVGLLAAKIAASVSRDLRQAVFCKVQSFANQEYHHFSTSSLITRNTNDVQQIQTAIVLVIRIIIYAPLLGIGALLKVLTTQSKMSWIVVLILTILLVMVGFMFVFVIPKFKKAQQLLDRLNLVTREFLNGLSVVRAFNTQDFEEKKFEQVNQDITKMNLFINRAMAIMMPFMMFVMNAGTLLIIWIGGHHIDAGTMQIGDMMAFIQYTMQIIMAFLLISMVSVMLPRAMVSLGRIKDVLEYENKIIDKENAITEFKGDVGTIRFEHVSFTYPNAEESVLEDIHFEIKQNETVAFIGSTGSGKSTLIQLIPRLYDVTKGAIYLNGINIKDIKQEVLESQIGYVPQKAILFSGTIASNLAFGKENPTLEEMDVACEIAHAKEFIEKKEKQYEEEIAQGGSNVSGGQKQRLAIARAMIKKPQFLIFDDSFSALDYKTDANIRKRLQQMQKENPTTVLIVAQRIRSIMNVDRILVLDNGKIVGSGTHEELLRSCEVYQEIARSQLSKEELGHE